MLAIVESYRRGLLNPKHWISNITAGFIVGIVALPLAMAFAIASGVKPEQGLYTAIIAALIVGLFGGSRVQIAGPTGAFVVILAHITARYGIDGLQIATLFAGLILMAMGFLRLGNVIKFIPNPVITGFTAGIGVIIFVGEWKDFFGLPATLPLDAHFYSKISTLIEAFPHLHGITTMLGLFSLALIFISKKIFKRLPGPLIAMITVTLIQNIFHFQGIATIGSALGSIPQSLPQFHLPKIQLLHAFTLIGPAFTIALLGAIESLLSASAADNITGHHHHSNQELIGQGIANIVSPLFGGFAATGAIARTATNVKNGGSSPLSAMVHSLFLILVLLFLAPLADGIPLCSLAAILFVVAYNMSDIPHFIHMIKHAPHNDVLVLLTTFFLTIFTDLVVAVNVGVILAMLLLMRRLSQWVSIEQESDLIHDRGTIIYRLRGPFFFGTAEKLERILSNTGSNVKNVVLRLNDVPFMDMTGIHALSLMMNEFRRRRINYYLTEINPNVIKKLIKAGVLSSPNDEQIFETMAQALAVITKTNEVPYSPSPHVSDTAV